MSTSPCGVVGVGLGARAAALVSGGGHGYAVGQGSVEGGQWSLLATGLAPACAAGGAGALAATAAGEAAGALHCAATAEVPAARQRTRKLPSVPLSTGCIS